jgi:hypothetical protein
MDMISLQGKTNQGKTNFFEKRVSEYSKAGVKTTTTTTMTTTMTSSSTTATPSNGLDSVQACWEVYIFFGVL